MNGIYTIFRIIVKKKAFYANNTGKNLQNKYFLYNPPIRSICFIHTIQSYIS